MGLASREAQGYQGQAKGNEQQFEFHVYYVSLVEPSLAWRVGVVGA
jgi:hypothetical protein